MVTQTDIDLFLRKAALLEAEQMILLKEIDDQLLSTVLAVDHSILKRRREDLLRIQILGTL